MLEYVASGSSYFKLMYAESLEPQNLDFFARTFGSLNNTHNHKISLLYNAYTEKRPGEWMGEHYRPLVHSIHADSGGLQMVTLGRTITNELKEEVYDSQARNSDIAMCFDVIPVRTLDGARSERLDLSNRRFDRTQLESCARETGRNLRRQIDFFDEKGSKARPMLITQGNDYDSYMHWTQYVVEELDDYHVSRIGGIAMGAAALGKGSLEDFKRAFYFTQLPINLESKHLHLLGVGSVYRMIPQFIFMQNGLYENVEMSYDSTTHTSGVTQGRYYKDDLALNFTRAFDDNYRIVWEDIRKNFPCYNYDLNTFYEALNISSRTYQEKHGNIDPSLQTYGAFVSSAIKNFLAHVEKLHDSRDEIMKMARGIDATAFNALYSVRTLEDFNHWLQQIGPYVASEPVQEYVQPVTLGDMFV
jgi:tRNA-guanine family transglycosylase